MTASNSPATSSDIVGPATSKAARTDRHDKPCTVQRSPLVLRLPAPYRLKETRPFVGVSTRTYSKVSPAQDFSSYNPQARDFRSLIYPEHRLRVLPSTQLSSSPLRRPFSSCDGNNGQCNWICVLDSEHVQCNNTLQLSSEPERNTTFASIRLFSGIVFRFVTGGLATVS